MADEFAIKGRPQLPGSTAAPQLAVQARPNQWGGPAPAANSDLQGLVEGLSAFNPALRQLHANANAQEGIDNAEGVRAGKAFGERYADPKGAITGLPIDVPDGTPQAYGAGFRAAAAETLAHRAGVENKLSAMVEYDDLKHTEGFNATSWLAQKRADALQGVADPRMVATLGAHFTELEASIRTDAEQQRRKAMDEARASSASAMTRDTITADMDADKMAMAFPVLQAKLKGIGYDNKQAAEFMLREVLSSSDKMGGAPELFDVFDKKMGDTGLRLIDMNPELGQTIRAAKAHATQTRDKAILEGAERGNGMALDGIEKDIDKNPFAVTEERLLAHFTKYGAIQSPTQYASLMNKARDAQMKFAANQQLMGLFDAGELWRLEPGQQNKIMDAKLGGAISILADANRSGDPAQVAQVGSLIMQAHSKSGATVAFDQLKNYVSTLTTNLQSKDGPGPAFQSAVELYKAMSANVQYRDLYFNDEVSKVLKGYISATSNGTDPKAAYTQAYQAVSPEAKAAAEAFTKTPDFQKLVASDAKKYVEGSSMFPRWLGGNGRPENQAVVGAWITGQLRDWRAQNPYATDKDAAEYAESVTKKNWVLDSSTGSAIKVPPGLGGPAAQEAFTEHSKEVAAKLELGNRSDAKWSVQYVPTGTEGFYNVVAFNGSATQSIGPVSLADMQTVQRAKKTLSDDERSQIGAMREGLKNGTPTAINQELLAKASAIGVLKPSEVQFYRDEANKQFLTRLQSIPNMSFGTPTADNLQFLPSKANVKIDNKLTAQTAAEFVQDSGRIGPYSGNTAAAPNLAASLITMGEAVALKAYDDPASGAGKNIGMGYNLKANAATVNEDLRRAGVDPSVIPMVLDGKAELTPDQAKRLLLVAMPRYEKQVKDVAESTSPGLWDRMLPQQRAVMIDVAWQVGDAGKFKKAWSSLASGDTKSFAEETKVFYTDRSGERKEDTRRGNLRASMLAGTTHWAETVSKFGGLPSTKLQAVALTK